MTLQDSLFAAIFHAEICDFLMGQSAVSNEQAA
jgi:hypothetical protein